jgi:signal transduction histidine kinase
MRIRYYLIIIIIVITIFPVGILAGWFYRNIADEYKKRSNIYLEQISNYIRSVVENKARNLKETLQNLADYIANADAELLNDLSNSNYSSNVIELALKLKNASGLDIIEIINSEGKILSSGHWTANYGQSQKIKLTWQNEVPLYHIERIVNKKVFTVQMKRSLKLADKDIYIIGGYILDEKSLLPQYLSPEVKATFVIDPDKVNEYKNKENIATRYFPKYFYDTEGKAIALLNVEISTEFIKQAFRNVYIKLIAIALLLLVISIALGIILSNHITKPLEILVFASSEVGKGNLNHYINYKTKGEIGSLISSFNYMIKSLNEAQQKLIVIERLNAWREAARRIAHEIKNPISPIQVCIKTLIKAKSDKPHIFDSLFEESTKTILEEVSKLHSLADSFSLFAQMPNPVKTLADINSLLRQILQLYKSIGEDINIIENYDENIPMINIDSKLISAALHNVIKNAVEALPKQDAKLKIETLLKEKDGNKWAVIKISDNGKGIKKEEIAMIFQPYFTTKSKGTGLGLTIAKEIISQHNGIISVESEENIGSTFIIELPV